MTPDSFSINGVNMRDMWGIDVITYDFLLPPLRPRKVVIPTRDGAYDYGARYYDERTLKIDCFSLGTRKSRADLRELASALSVKGQIVLWDEPDKYYYGRIYNAVDLNYIFMIGHSFTLQFICDPFAYGRTFDMVMPTRIDYRGTANTPTRMTFRNMSSSTVNGFQIRIRDRK